MSFNKKEYRYIVCWSKKLRAIELLGGKCQKCNETKPWLLIFHHNDSNEKEDCINSLKSYKWSIIKKEVLKCSLLCENCHRKLHKDDNKETEYYKSKKILLDIKNLSGCEHCGYNEYIGALDFHHEKDKNFNIGTICICENSCDKVKEKIIEEINKCKVLCANCHQDLHFDKERFENYKEKILNYQIKEQLPNINKEEVINLYNQGITQIEIAKIFNRNKSVIAAIIKKSGVPKQLKFRLNKKEVIDLYNSGMSQIEIAQKFHKCSKTIWRIINSK